MQQSETGFTAEQHPYDSNQTSHVASNGLIDFRFGGRFYKICSVLDFRKQRIVAPFGHPRMVLDKLADDKYTTLE